MLLTKPDQFKDGMLIVYSDFPFESKSVSPCSGCILRVKNDDTGISFTYYRNEHKHKSCTCVNIGDFCHVFYSGAYYKPWKEEVTGVLSIGDI